MSRLQPLGSLDPALYHRSPLHAPERIWLEKNCYVDIWIELLHALRLDPHAMLGPALALDFIGDQWTFLKPVHAHLWTLYGIDVQELTVWQPLLEQVREQLANGRLISSEADAWWLPDTVGTDYRRQHTKSTIVIAALDEPARRLDYFHNAGFYTLEGEDFARLFRVDSPPDAAFMPLFAEWIAIDRRKSIDSVALARQARALLPECVQRMSVDNPVRRFAARYLADAHAIHQRGIAHYHAWAFANTRQLGASMELAQAHLTWLQGAGTLAVPEAIAAAGRIAIGCKALILKGARSAMTGKVAGLEDSLGELAGDWQRLHDSLQAAL